ncbi:Indoleamine 2,3-dioxygenase [Coniophora puteana RWD-64-598 SS2]|uniref:Indoleamine 2,3-dioxygenase n=1 Tax=Coniophora puteana (strain RWD-64-598) TaxID=741705 RepID=A0A5M3N0Z0_CONPW|nr:Indoleamine 2,3-dioxygenase [Coniophora puteana RWD-64-598 SS2]EIW84551.1 Indoleamine 2,3-dioxygenase [Coniophora puteana RWD-64-598 SS2]
MSTTTDQFDIHTHTGFMPPEAPLRRLSVYLTQYEAWEVILDDAIGLRLQLGSKEDLTSAEVTASARWRARLEKMPVLSGEPLMSSEHFLRRAHHVLAYLLHFYVNSLPPSTPVIIPHSISLPILSVSCKMDLPPVLTYSDNVLYNWHVSETEPPKGGLSKGVIAGPAESMLGPSSADKDAFGFYSPKFPTVDRVTVLQTFTSTRSEEVFYLASQRVELAGARALALMETVLDELFLSDDLAFRRITSYLDSLASVIAEMQQALESLKDGCEPEVFYGEVRGWFFGEKEGNPWVWEGAEEAGFEKPTKTKGPSAGQSTVIHALDIFLGLGNCVATRDGDASANGGEASYRSPGSLLRDMQAYMPERHRALLIHLSVTPRQLRAAIDGRVASSRAMSSDDWDSESLDTDTQALLDAYNASVAAVRSLRDGHIRIVAAYIVSPAANERTRLTEKGSAKDDVTELETPVDIGKASRTAAQHAVKEARELKGTGGTDLVRFLKGVRDQTAHAALI